VKGIVFVPGISGSEIIFRNEAPPIWPPKWNDFPTYQEMDELCDPTEDTVGNVIDTVAGLYPVYQTTENDLQNISATINGVANGPYLPAPYDWRIDLLTVVDDVANKIEAFANSSGMTDITIVSHSMGGLLTRLLFEWKYANNPPPWLAKIRRALFICTPHLGAPAALARILGLEWAETVITPADMKRFADDPNFPSTYELLPSATRGILLDTTTSEYIRYDDPNVASALGMSSLNIGAAQKCRQALDPSKKPTNVNYIFVYGTGHATDEYVTVQGLSLNGATPQQDGLGDGSVPIWSITEAAAQFVPNVQTKSFVGDHVGILTTDEFRQFLYGYFGLGAPAPLVKGAPGMVVSLNKRSFAPGETMHVLMIPDEEASVVSGSLNLSRVSPANKEVSVLGVRQEVTFRGGPARYLTSKLTAPKTPGLYRLDFGGTGASHQTSNEVAGWFVVRRTSGIGNN